MHTWTPPVYRKSYKKKYGSKCFLEPAREKYPICTKGKVNPKALNAAQYYLHFQKPSKKKKQLTRKIEKLRKKMYSMQ